MDRKYSDPEIGALRQAVVNKFLWGRFGPMVSCETVEGAGVVEEHVRTFMLAGTTADDLLEWEARHLSTPTTGGPDVR